MGGDTVDTTVPGTYIITYNVSDTAGNIAAEIFRTVVILDGGENMSFEVDEWDAENPDGYRTTITGWNLTGSGTWGLNRRNGPVASNCGPGFDGDQFLFIQTSDESSCQQEIDAFQDGIRYDISFNVSLQETSPGMMLEVWIGNKQIYGPVTHFYREGFREVTIPFRYLVAEMNEPSVRFVFSAHGDTATLLLDNISVKMARRLDFSSIMNTLDEQLDEVMDNKWSQGGTVWTDVVDPVDGYAQQSGKFPCYDHTGEGILDDLHLKLLEPILNDEPCIRLMLGDTKVDQIQNTFMMNRNFVVSREFNFQSQLTNYSRVTGTMTGPYTLTITYSPMWTNEVAWQTNALTEVMVIIDPVLPFIGNISTTVSLDVPSLWNEDGILNELSEGFGDATADLLAAYMTIGDQNSVDYMQHILSLAMIEGFRYQQDDFLVAVFENNTETPTLKYMYEESAGKSYFIPTIQDVSVLESFSAPYPEIVIEGTGGVSAQFKIRRLGSYIAGAAFQTGLENWINSYELGTQELSPQVTDYTLQGLPGLLSADGDLNEDGQTILESYNTSSNALALFRTNEGMDCPDIVEGEPTVCFEINEVTILLPGDVPLELVRIPASTFMMGRYPGEQDSSSFEDPQHQVKLSHDFYLGKYELTKRQWHAIMGTLPWLFEFYRLKDLDSPAVYVSWHDAQSFITALNTHVMNTGQGTATFRLPSEAEWEYACRAGTTTRFYWGDDPSYTVGSDYCWWQYNARDVSEQYAHVVGLKLPNAFGLYDMNGNVYEYCEDDWHTSYTGAPTDGSAWVDSPRAPYCVGRGGSWYNSGSWCRSACRATIYPGATNGSYGFRLALVR